MLFAPSLKTTAASSASLRFCSDQQKPKRKRRARAPRLRNGSTNHTSHLGVLQLSYVKCGPFSCRRQVENAPLKLLFPKKMFQTETIKTLSGFVAAGAAGRRQFLVDCSGGLPFGIFFQ